MDKHLFKLVEFVVLLILLGECRKIVVAQFSQAYDTHVIHRLELHAVPHPVAEGEEPRPLPSQLLDLLGRFRHLVEETLQLRELAV